MSEENRSAQPIGPEPRISKKLFDYLLREQRETRSRDQDALTNPELEQLLGSLSKLLEKRAADAVLGTEAPMPLTLEDLVAAAENAAGPSETSPKEIARELVVPCTGCGSPSTAAARFCATCGLDLRPELGAANVPRKEPEAVATARALLENKLQIEAARRSSRAWKVACLALLCLILGMVVFQQHLWRSSLLIERGASSVNATPAPAPVVTPSPPKSEMGDVTHQRIEQPLATTRAPAEPPKTATSPGKRTSRTAAIKPSSSGRLPAKGKLKSPHSAAQTSTLSAFPTSIDLPNARIQGSVVIRATVDSDGNVRRLRFVSGNPLLADSAMEALKRWRYRPYLLDGKPIEVQTTITVNFGRQ